MTSPDRSSGGSVPGFSAADRRALDALVDAGFDLSAVRGSSSQSRAAPLAAALAGLDAPPDAVLTASLIDRTLDAIAAERPVLSAASASALDALVDAGWSASAVAPADRPGAHRIAAQLSELDAHTAPGPALALPPSLAEGVLRRVDRVRHGYAKAVVVAPRASRASRASGLGGGARRWCGRFAAAACVGMLIGGMVWSMAQTASGPVPGVPGVVAFRLHGGAAFGGARAGLFGGGGQASPRFFQGSGGALLPAGSGSGSGLWGAQLRKAAIALRLSD